MALKEETTEGVPVLPTAAGDYIALQDGFSMEPSFAELDNAELTGSIANAKTVLGIEEPAASLSHYFRGSGVEGTAPNYGPLLKNAFGNETEKGTEDNTVAASTVSVVNVDAGEGATYSRGSALLVKQSATAYEIRNVLSIATDALTLAQDLAVAPGTGIDLGQHVLYSPANSGHPTHSMWLYRGNNAAGAIEMMAGARVTEVGIESTAGEFINASYSLEGNEYFYDPIEILAADVSFDYTDDATARVGTIEAKMYKDPYELAAAIGSAMDVLSGNTITCVYDDSLGKFTITSDGTTLDLDAATGPNIATSGYDKIAFAATDLTGSLSYTSDSVLSNASPQTPIFDSADPLVAKANEVLLGPDGQDITCFEASSVSVTLSNTKADILSVCSSSGKSGSVFSERTATIEVSALLNDYQAEEFKNFRSGDNMLFTYNCGEKSGGNWVAGKCMNVHSPTCTISSFALGDSDGLVTLDMTLTTYTNSGLGEIFVNQL
jgi:hypothetical protein